VRAASERQRGSRTHTARRRELTLASTIPSPGGKSKVTSILLSSTNEFKRLLKAGAGNTAALEDILKCVRAQLKVPLIQGCLEYGYKTSPGTPFPGLKDAARKGELWAFCAGVLPFLHEANAVDAAKLRVETDIVPNDNKAQFSEVLTSSI
jgi:hypothetical protein